MSQEWDTSDLARMLALEHAFGALSLMWSCQFAQTAGIKPSEAAAQYRSAILSSLYDAKDYPPSVHALIKQHLEHMLDNLTKMAAHADGDFS
jgi:hypothetical protein